jgi:hypothetical protein
MDGNCDNKFKKLTYNCVHVGIVSGTLRGGRKIEIKQRSEENILGLKGMAQ